MSIFPHAYQSKAKEALKLAMPIIAGQLGQILMGFFDTVQIGGLGAEYIAGSGFGNNVFWIVNLLGMGILFAVSTLVSEACGETSLPAQRHRHLGTADVYPCDGPRPCQRIERPADRRVRSRSPPMPAAAPLSASLVT